MKDRLQSKNCSKYLKGLADPERLRIIQCLQNGPHNVGEITEMLEGQLANISHHLGVLRHTGLVCDEKQGKFVMYCLNPEVFRRDKNGKLPDIIDFGCCKLELND